jgi:hypothetical protein
MLCNHVIRLAGLISAPFSKSVNDFEVGPLFHPKLISAGVLLIHGVNFNLFKRQYRQCESVCLCRAQLSVPLVIQESRFYWLCGAIRISYRDNLVALGGVMQLLPAGGKWRLHVNNKLDVLCIPFNQCLIIYRNRATFYELNGNQEKTWICSLFNDAFTVTQTM